MKDKDDTAYNRSYSTSLIVLYEIAESFSPIPLEKQPEPFVALIPEKSRSFRNASFPDPAKLPCVIPLENSHSQDADAAEPFSVL